MPKKVKRISRHIRDEFRRCAAVHAYATVFTKSGMKQAAQHKLMEDMFHGSDTVKSHKKMLANGEGTVIGRLYCTALLFVAHYFVPLFHFCSCL